MLPHPTIPNCEPFSSFNSQQTPQELARWHTPPKNHFVIIVIIIIHSMPHMRPHHRSSSLPHRSLLLRCLRVIPGDSTSS